MYTGTGGKGICVCVCAHIHVWMGGVHIGRRGGDGICVCLHLWMGEDVHRYRRSVHMCVCVVERMCFGGEEGELYKSVRVEVGLMCQ